MQDKLTEAPVRNTAEFATHPDVSLRPDYPGPVRKRKARGGLIFLLVLAACVAGVFAWRATHKAPAEPVRQTGAGARGRSVPVAVAVAGRRDLPIYLDGLGSVTAFNTVTVKSRVDGQLAEVNFKEGQDVKEGQRLAVIDTRPFQVALSQAEANFARDQSQLTDATLNKQRFQQLAQQGVIAQQQSDTQGALVGQLQGSINADQAQIDNAKLQLTFCYITAPISGRVGLRLVDRGNIVHASDPSGLLVITQMEPIAVLFTLPEDSLPAVAKRMHDGVLPVIAMSRDGSTELARGTLQTMDNQIDQTTGTIRLKAVFDNKDRALWPNQFVNARLLLDVKKDAVTMPAAAVQTGSQGTFVYVVKDNKTVEVQPVTIGLTEGNIVAVDKGIAPGEQVVTDGQEGLRAGATVEPRDDARAGAGGGANGRARGNFGGARGGNSDSTPGGRGNGGQPGQVNGDSQSAGPRTGARSGSGDRTRLGSGAATGSATGGAGATAPDHRGRPNRTQGQGEGGQKEKPGTQPVGPGA